MQEYDIHRLDLRLGAPSIGGFTLSRYALARQRYLEKKRTSLAAEEAERRRVHVTNASR